MAKFEEEMDTKFSDCCELVKEIKALTEDYGRRLSESATTLPLAQTLVQFARLAVETPDTVLRLLRSGELAPCYVILRWYLEMAQLCCYLWQNPEKYKFWLEGTHIRAKDIGTYFETIGFHSWKDAYQDWSNVVHGNRSFVETAHVTSCRAEKTVAHVILGNALVNLIWLMHKFNYIFGKYLTSLHGAEMDEFSKRFNSMEERTWEVTKRQRAFEEMS